jgi:hypothetical protein
MMQSYLRHITKVLQDCEITVSEKLPISKEKRPLPATAKETTFAP